MCLSVCHQFEILLLTAFNVIAECSRMFQNILECSRMFQNVPECSRMFQYACRPMSLHADCRSICLYISYEFFLFSTFFIHQTRNRGEILAFWVWDMQLKTSHLKGWPRTGIREFYFLFVRHAGQASGREEQSILSVISRPHHYPGPCGCLSLVWHKLVWIVNCHLSAIS